MRVCTEDVQEDEMYETLCTFAILGNILTVLPSMRGPW